LDLILNVYFGEGYRNAFWDGDEMTFGDGDGSICINFKKSLDVVAHGLAHGVT
jgi:Zn-dependent metalloprotease